MAEEKREEIMKIALRRLPGLAAAALILVLGLAIVSCGGSEASPEDAQDGAAMEDMDMGEEMDDAAHIEGDDDADAHDAEAHVDEPAGGFNEFTLVASDTFSYAPAELTVTVGEPVRILLDNDRGVLLHDINVEKIPAIDVQVEGTGHDDHGEASEPEPVEHAHADGSMDMHEAELPDVHVAAEAGGSAVLEFTPTEPGTYTFYCSVEGHRAAGMEGTITVQAE